MQFYRLAPGARFECEGRQFLKLAMSMARDEQANIGCIFPGDTEVTPIGEPLLLSEAEAARWKPREGHWTDGMAPAPGADPVELAGRQGLK